MSVSLVKRPALSVWSVVYVATSAAGVPSYGMSMQVMADTREAALSSFAHVTSGEPFLSSGWTYRAFEAFEDSAAF